MTKGFEFDADDGRIRFVNGSRVVATTDGTLINLLPTEYTMTGKTASFPDVPKNICYLWTGGRVHFAPAPTASIGESCACFITATPQEWSYSQTLMAAPTGADFFIGRIRINRTTAPQTTWLGNTLNVLPVQNQYMSIPGSFSALMECDMGFARAIHVYITGGNLVLEQQQSVGPAAGGYGTFPTRTNGSSYHYQGSFEHTGTAGLPVYRRDGKNYGWNTVGGTGVLTVPVTYKRTGSSPCATNDIYSYASTYTVDVIGRFGRRS